MFSRPSMFKQLALLIAMLLTFVAGAQAANDPRMVVRVTADEQGKMPSVQDAIQQALPFLWDRVVEDAARASVSDSMRATPFLLRVVPHADYVEVTFNDERVWQYLDQKQIAYFREPLRLNLQIEMVNSSDKSMPKTAEALLMHAREVAVARGIILDATAPLLQAKWRWLDAVQVYLKVDGESLLTGFSETRLMKAGEPLEQLQAWVEALLIKARNTRVADAALPVEPTTEQPQMAANEFLLTIEQKATLPAQVVFEDALRQNSHVKLLIPTFLSANSRQYRLVLNSGDDTWLSDWFRRRGMQATPVPGGWLVQ